LDTGFCPLVFSRIPSSFFNHHTLVFFSIFIEANSLSSFRKLPVPPLAGPSIFVPLSSVQVSLPMPPVNLSGVFNSPPPNSLPPRQTFSCFSAYFVLSFFPELSFFSLRSPSPPALTPLLRICDPPLRSPFVSFSFTAPWVFPFTPVRS